MNSFKATEWVKGVWERSKNALTKTRGSSLTDTFKDRRPLHHAISILRAYRLRLLKGVGALGLLASVSIGGNQYVKLHTYEVYHVYVGDQQAGTVSDPKVVEDFILTKHQQLEEQNPNVHMVMNSEAINYKAEKAFNIQSNDEAALVGVDRLLVTKAVGVELVVSGQSMGIVKDKEAADAILDQIKSKFAPAATAAAKAQGAVSVLSAKAEPQIGAPIVEKVEFVEPVEIVAKDIQPAQLIDPQEIVRKLETGDVAPSKYTVVAGDCVGCIAKKLNIPRQLIYEKNPWIQDDKIKIGQVLDVTVLKPALTVRTVEKVVENQEIQFDTVYEKDENMRAGQTQAISPGQNGLKKVTFQLIKENGYLAEEQVLGEEVLVQPVSAVAKKGTKVILGEGTGKFIWPVLSPNITSSFGERWGKLHKGIDITGNKNIMAADNGIVIYVGDKRDGYGNQIIIDHQNGYKTIYGHLSQFFTSKGKIVEKGEKIGYMGSTGDSTGTHLHFEVQRSGTAENPMKFLSR
ncbi:peptidoglycan DD-metalloendopeptidase family protein [Paenibacillus koleovorans]|uniref:peptidoglycan DD-metalloendopeptidase family protein n=1 Tax=Paenibacillus koleovorans TaxID=121608 RepID=UPI000FD990B2|nr:peptidoglycan DD-metalloendopeptidase family protein [Paenibacillus koleovorans]